METDKSKNNGRRIIYVDASFNNKTEESKISLYDKEVNKLDTLILTKPNSSFEAEKYAILNACLYIQKKNIINQKVHILNDNFNATKDEKILDFCKSYNIGLSWIPREVNIIADNGTKLEVNIKEDESHILEFFYDFIMKSSIDENVVSPKKKVIIKQDNNQDIIIEDTKRINIIINAVRHSSIKDKSYVSIGQVGKYLMDNNPTFEYLSLKQELLKYEKTFVIVNDNFVKLK